MIEQTIADTGAIVGLIYEQDQWHEWTAAQAANLPVPYLTCEAVITESCYLLKEVPNGAEQVFTLLKSGALQLAFDLSAEVETISALMEKYKDVPMSLADACLVRMSEILGNARVFTIDSDFWVYRKNGKEQIPLIIPDKT